jgi:hypothetical protein
MVPGGAGAAFATALTFSSEHKIEAASGRLSLFGENGDCPARRALPETVAIPGSAFPAPSLRDVCGLTLPGAPAIISHELVR